MKPLIIRRTWDAFAEVFPKTSLDLNYLRRTRNYEPDLWQIPRFCSKHQAAIDVGANMGIFSRWMAKHAGQVHSFECNPSLIPGLHDILPGNVQVHPVGLSDEPGRVQLRFDPGNTGIGTIEQRNKLDQNAGIKDLVAVDVDVKRLDDFAFQNVSFIKIDVEGHEGHVLAGAAHTLAIHRPTLLIEIEERHCPGSLDQIPAWLAQFGYTPSVLNASGELEAVATLHGPAARGVNNFWFRCARG